MTDHNIQSSIAQQIAQELAVKPEQALAAIQLLDDGATVPFIARYRKEATQGLSDSDLRQLESRVEYLRELHAQKEMVLNTIQEQGHLTESLKTQIQHASTKQALADIYQPFKPKRQSKASQAIEAGLEPLANRLWDDHTLDPVTVANDFINPDQNVPTTKAALAGAQAILAERWADNPAIVQPLRDRLRQDGFIFSKAKSSIIALLKENKSQEASQSSKPEDAAASRKKETLLKKKAQKFSDYFDRQEALIRIASHRTLALFRGRREQILDLAIDNPTDPAAPHPCVGQLHQLIGFTPSGQAADEWLSKVVQWCWRTKLHPKLENDLMAEIKDKADQESIEVFARNLTHLLMAAPAGSKTTMGIDPGLRTGIKVAIVSPTGDVIAHETLYPHAPKNQWADTKAAIKTLVQTHGVNLIAIGNGTASRETDKLVAEILRENPDLDLKKAVISEAGASVYSASEFASKELPDLDVSIRGAVSIARRLQDPLAELVKVEPKSIGVGQYQHDVSQPKLGKSLETVVIDCVNRVGVDVNTASAPLLARVAGLNLTIAQNIVSFRQSVGTIKRRDDLTKVPRLGRRTFEQAAGFLRVLQGENPLDASAVHPESYPLVQKMADKLGLPLEQLIGQEEQVKKLAAHDFVDEQFGLPTVQDVLQELEKPGRDPRPEFKPLEFRDDVQEIKDLKVGMILNGVVTNVTNFGAFIDVGVHQDGLVHISAMTDRFISDPHSIVKAGDSVKVKVLAVDVDRTRIDLTMKLNHEPQDISSTQKPKSEHAKALPRRDKPQSIRSKPNQTPGKKSFATQEKALPPGKTGTFADLFADLKNKS